MTATLLPDGVMDSVRMFAPTQRTPLGHIEPLPPDQEVLTNFLRPPPHEEEIFTFTSFFLTRILSKPSILHHF